MNNTVSHARIELVPGKEGILQVEGSDASVKIRLLTQESAWVGELITMEVTGNSELDLSKKLIKLIKEQPFLYDKTLEEFKDEERKSQAWNVIGQSLNMSAEDAQIRWARLRVDFGRHRRRMREAESRGIRIKSWPFYGLLTWLAPHVKMRAKRGQSNLGVKTQSMDYKSNLTHADWLMNSNGSVKVEVSPSIVMHSDQEDVTESFIVSPDTADYEDDEENAQMYGKQQGKLKDQEIRSYCKKYGFEYTFYVENMDAAFKNSSENFIFALDGDVFRWKRRLGAGTQQVARLGEVKMIQVDQIDAFQTALNKSLETLSSFEEKLKKLQTENKTLKKERDTALEKVTEFAQLKCEWEKKLYGQFVAVLNSKKERIQALEEMLDLNLSDKAPSTDGAKQRGHSLEDQVEDEASEEDPFAGDTDVDSDVDGDVTLEKASVSCAPSTSRLRRSRDLFASSFDESDMPNSPPALPKRARASKTCTASSSSSSTVTARKVVPRENLEDDQDDVRTAESTQDLISQM